MTKEELYKRWQCFDSELGSNHEDTKRAKQDYFDYCKKQDHDKQRI